MSEKKPSLFKQRMKQRTQGGEQPPAEVFKVELPEARMEVEYPKEQAPSSRKPLLQELQHNNMISQAEYDEISRHNDQYMKKLSEQEIQQMQAQLQQELSPAFIDKLFQSAHSTPLGQQQPEQADMEQDKPNPFFEQSTKPPPAMVIEQPERQQLYLAICERMSKLCVNSSTNEISYSDEECPAQLVNIRLIGLMVDSGNNQSLVTGLKVLGQLLIGLRQLPWSYGLTIIGSYYWHQYVLLDFIGRSIVESVIKQLGMNSFKTCRLQIIQTLLLYSAMGGQLDAKLITSLKQQAQDNQHQAKFPKELLEVKPAQRQASIWRKLEGPHSAQTAGELMQLLNNPAVLIQKLMLEYAFYSTEQACSQLRELLHYYINLLQLLKTYPEQRRQAELQNGISMLYRIVESCVLKLKIHEEVVVRSFLGRFGRLLHPFLEYVMERSQETVTLYRVMYCLKKSYKVRFIELLKLINQDKLCLRNFKQVEPVLCLLNLKEYAQHHEQEDVQLINRMLQTVRDWVEHTEHGYISMELLFLQLLRVFRLPEEIYQSLDQHLLEQVLAANIDKLNTGILSKILQENMALLKKLVNSYNFNSFGSLVYSKVLLFMSSMAMPVSCQTYITTECLQRYPFIFYEAGKTSLYGQRSNPNLYSFKLRVNSVQVQLQQVADMLSDKKQDRQENGFLKMLN